MLLPGKASIATRIQPHVHVTDVQFVSSLPASLRDVVGSDTARLGAQENTGSFGRHVALCQETIRSDGVVWMPEGEGDAATASVAHRQR